MTKKFTEEQFQHMVAMEGMYVFTDLEYQRQALRNPITREWARAKFVEEEKKYYWISNKNNAFGLYETDGVVLLKATDWAPLTESEIREWGYNPEMFDKEEVQ